MRHCDGEWNSMTLTCTQTHTDQSSLNCQGTGSLIRACRVMIHVQLHIDIFFYLDLE